MKKRPQEDLDPTVLVMPRTGRRAFMRVALTDERMWAHYPELMSVGPEFSDNFAADGELRFRSRAEARRWCEILRDINPDPKVRAGLNRKVKRLGGAP